ncbi:anhydro-N-acetylmuramic acid kinase [Alphaproteobacteria bacterium]|nr:anhydro-N-acetylmuramic acid kinase [Alphaproteobacteria bacterium]
MKYNFLNIIGLMTGTSMDGIDISLVQTNGLYLKRLNKNYFYEYNTKTKKTLTSILKEDLNFNLNRKNYLDDFITNEHYLALKDLDILNSCDLIGFHGQTLYHDPDNKISIQLGNPKKLSQMLSKNIIFDFRSKDLSLGGQGAPIAPTYHKFIIETLDIELPCCFLNIGGISNLTYWDGETLIGFDAGPGNVLMDDFMSSKLNKNYDKDGILASKGTPIKEEVSKFLKFDFFKKPPPKSLDRQAFIYFYNELVKKNYSVPDIMATLAELTVETIVTSLELLPKKVKNIIITGGGYRNIHLMDRLNDKLKIKILNEKKIGINFDYIEAELIAYLSARSIYKLPFTFPSTTGVSKPSSGGKLYKYL